MSLLKYVHVFRSYNGLKEVSQMHLQTVVANSHQKYNKQYHQDV